MPESPALEMQKWIYDTLLADAATMALVKGVYDRVPEGAEFPYISFGPVDEQNIYPVCIDSADLRIQLDVWSREPGYPEIKRIAATVHIALNDQDVDLPVNAACYLTHDQTTYMRDPDGLTSHAVIQLDAFVERRP